jgi:hypothetical protein
VGAAAEVHDGKAAVPEAAAAQAEYPFPVGPAARHALRHVGDGPDFCELLVETQFPGNSTHEKFTPEKYKKKTCKRCCPL